jgi:hypothetical protein
MDFDVCLFPVILCFLTQSLFVCINTGWYSGRIHLASGTMNKYIIRMDDSAMTEISPEHVRPHIEPEIDDVVEYSRYDNNQHEYFTAIVVEVYEDDYIDIINLSTNNTVSISHNRIRRDCETNY